MTKFWVKFKSWFKPKSAKKKLICRPKTAAIKLETKPTNHYQPINYRHYRKLIGKLAKRAIADQRARPRRNR